MLCGEVDVGAWWGAMRDWFTKDGRLARVVEYGFTIALIAVAVVAGVLSVIMQLRGR